MRRIVLCGVWFTFLVAFYLRAPSGVLAAPSVYWGAYIAGNQYKDANGNHLSNPPWNWAAVDRYEANTKKKISLLHWGQRWYWSGQNGYLGIGDGKFQKFETNIFDSVRQKGVIPMIDWNSWAVGTNPETGQTYGQPSPNIKLSDIYNGKYDSYIRQWATDAKNWGYPFFLRHNHEMNGTWYSYSERANGNSPGDFVKAWRHVHDIFTEVGASNVTWVWCPNADYQGSIPLEELYPGDAYVDWTCIDAYNASSDKNDSWKTFNQIFKPTYDHILQIAPSKPMMIGETGSSKDGGSKPTWIADALETQLPNNFPKIKALAWFNWDNNQTFIDWPIEGNHFDLDNGAPVDTASINAFTNGIASDYYATNSYSNLPKLTKVPVLLNQPTPTPTPSVTPTPTPGGGQTLNFGFMVQGVNTAGKTGQVDLLLRNATLPPVDINGVVAVSDSIGVFRPTDPVSLGEIPAGTYEVFIRDQSHLKKRLGSMTITTGANTAPASFNGQVFIAGDFNANNILNIVDVALLLGKMTSISVPVNSSNSKYDVNLDGIIDESDITIVLDNLTSLQIPGQ